MSRKIFVGVMLFATLIIILVLCIAISPEGKKKLSYNYSEVNSVKSDNSDYNKTDLHDKEKNKEKNKQNEEKIAYLTFDDGPSKNTKKVLDILDQYNIKATFFLIGSSITDEYVEQLKNMEKTGHSIGIHTFSHKYNQIYLSKETYLNDFNKAKDILSQYLIKEPKIYRFPGGSCNCFIGSNKKEIINELKKEGYNYYDWNVSGEDSINRPSCSFIINNVIKDYKDFDKPIILLHDGPSNDNTVRALPTIIDNIKKSDYSFGVLR